MTTTQTTTTAKMTTQDEITTPELTTKQLNKVLTLKRRRCFVDTQQIRFEDLEEEIPQKDEEEDEEYQIRLKKAWRDLLECAYKGVVRADDLNEDGEEDESILADTLCELNIE